MTREQAERILERFPGWSIGDGFIQKDFKFKSYLEGLDFAYTVGKVAEEQNHHPDMKVGWRRVRVTLSTHVIKGLSMNDFIIAGKAEIEYQKYSVQ